MSNSITPSTSSPEVQHGNMLKNALRFAALPDQGEAFGVTVSQVEKCRDAIAKGVEAFPPALAIFVMHQGWYRHAATRELFSAYVEAGHIPLKPSSEMASHPLEAAISRPNVDLLRALLECGADPNQIPSEACRLHGEVDEEAEGVTGDIVEVRDALHFVELINGDTETAHEMTALIRAHSMRRLLLSSGADTATQNSGPTASTSGTDSTTPGIKRPRRAPI